MWKTFLIVGFWLGLTACQSPKRYQSFTPGELWLDDKNVHINAHGGGILFENGRYYWFGEHKTAGDGGNKANVGVHCYSSGDLYNWKDEGVVLHVEPEGSGSPIEKGCILERPKVIHNAKTGKYVMWFHLEPKGQGYRGAQSGVAVSDEVTGPYTFIHAGRVNAGKWACNASESLKEAPVFAAEDAYTGGGLPASLDSLNIHKRDWMGGQMARDMTLFVDDDGKAYHIYASEENSTLQIAQLTDDYTEHNGVYARCFEGRFMEAPAMFKHKGKYYLIMSGCTGWAPNAARSAVADSILGPWRELGNPCIDADSALTYHSQSTFVLPVQGKEDTYIYMGDRWTPKDAIDGRYIWLPIQFEGERVVIPWKSEWKIGEESEKEVRSYHFDENGISRAVLENYLDRSMTLSNVLIPREGETQLADDIRMIKNTGVKFVGRAILVWEQEHVLNNPEFWSKAKAIIDELHQYDSDLVFQGCLFEAVSEEVNQIEVPDWVFEAYGQIPEKRNFRYEDMLNEEGKYVDHWHKGGSVPDISRLETQMWFYFLARTYFNIGCEAFHLGQIELMAMNDPDKSNWFKLVDDIRAYARNHARRHWVILDAHTPKGGMVVGGKSLIDFNSFPMRICAIPTEKKWEEGEVQPAELRVHHLDALFLRSEGCVTPSGWDCESLPYLVEIDNYGKEEPVNVADTASYFPWGWDEISWYAKQPEAYRNEWLQYAWDWMKKTDSNGHIEMPGIRGICCPNETKNVYRANMSSAGSPYGYNQEEIIKEIWKNDN